MTTAYEEILNQGNKVLRHLTCNLDIGKLWYRGKLVFDGDKFLDAWDKLNAMGLISCTPGESRPCNWRHKVKELYLRYQRCLPKPRTFLNFKTISKKDVDPLAFTGDFDYWRCALELYILFHRAQRDLLWENEQHFFIKITEGCIVYRKWLL